MTLRKDWSENEIIGIFDALGLMNREAKDIAAPDKIGPKTPQRDTPVYLPRLSNSSVPPPTGRTKNAKLEKPSKRS